MTNKKSTKRSLIMSGLALFICISMFIGSTYAWFTDSVISAGNIIKSGTLDVTMEWKDATATGAQQTYKDASEGAIFNYDLWEPGYVEAKNIKISNVGTLALKYNLNIAANGEVSELADVIDVYFAEGEYTLASRAMTELTKVGTLSDILKGMPANMAGDLKANTADTVTIALKMQETAGNEYQGLSIGSDFKVVLMATQDTVEKDSFNNQYDKDAVYGDVMVSSDAELKAAIEDSDMKVIAVNGDLTYNWGSKSYENSKALLMKGKTFLGANDAASITFAGYGSANPIVDATFRNITIKDITKGDNESSWEHGYLEFKNLNAVNVTFANSIMMEGDFATFKNCSFNSNKDDEYAVWVANGDATFEGCTFTGPRGVKVHEAYNSEVGTVVIDNNTFAGLTKKPGVAIGTVDADTTIKITNNVFAATQPGDQNNYKYETDTDVTTFNFVEENNTVPTTAGSSRDLSTAIANGKAAALTGDVQYNTAINNDATIYLAGNTFEATSTINLGNNADLTMKGGSYEVNGTYGHIDARPSTAEGSVLVFEDIDFSFNKKGPTYGTCTDRLGTVLEVCATVADAKTVVVFKNCTFDNAKVLFEGMSGKIGEFEATFENCTFKALTSSAPIEVMNYVKGTITVKNCTFNLECTSGSASAICVSPSSSTSVTIVAEDNTINAVAATPHTYDPAAGETEVDNVKVYGTPSNVKFISSYANTTVTETNTVKTGIAG